MFSGKADCDEHTQLRKFACLKNRRAKGHLCPFKRDNIACQTKKEKELECSIKKNNIGSRLLCKNATSWRLTIFPEHCINAMSVTNAKVLYDAVLQ